MGLRVLSQALKSHRQAVQESFNLKLDYCKELFSIENIIALKDKKLWDKITDSNSKTALDDLLPPERSLWLRYVRGVITIFSRLSELSVSRELL